LAGQDRAFPGPFHNRVRRRTPGGLPPERGRGEQGEARREGFPGMPGGGPAHIRFLLSGGRGTGVVFRGVVGRGAQAGPGGVQPGLRTLPGALPRRGSPVGGGQRDPSLSNREQQREGGGQEKARRGGTPEAATGEQHPVLRGIGLLPLPLPGQRGFPSRL